MTKCQPFLDLYSLNFEDFEVRKFLEPKASLEGNILRMMWSLYIEHTQN